MKLTSGAHYLSKLVFKTRKAATGLVHSLSLSYPVGGLSDVSGSVLADIYCTLAVGLGVVNSCLLNLTASYQLHKLF